MATAGQILRADEWAVLVGAIREGTCTLMLGPDAIGVLDGGRRVPAAEAMASYLRRRIEREMRYARTDLKRTAAVAEVVLNAARDGRSTLVEWVEDFYAGVELDDPVLGQLAQLPFGLVVNTMPGLSIERAFQARAPCEVRHYDHHGKSTRMLPVWSAEHPLIYHLCGSLERPSSLVLSDTDQLEFMKSIIEGSPPLPSNLTSTFKALDRSFIFLGFRLYRWQLRILMHVLDHGTPRMPRSLAFEVPATEVDEGTRNFYSTGHKIDFVDLSVGEFVGELVARFDGEPGEPTAGRILPGSPEVFLCHASEDADVANELATRLRASGVNTWLDRDDIRGGAEWDSLIERTLKDRVEYVVVLQSRNLAAKRSQRSYVNKEISIALEVQQYYSAPRVFLLPVYIDADRVSDERLDHLQSIDVTNPAGLKRLVDTIQRDIQRGQKLW